MKKHFLGCLFFLGILLSNAQTPDLVRLEYTVIPENDSGIQTSRYRAVLNAPLKLSDRDDYFVIGGEYNEYHFDVNRPLPFESNSLETLHIIDLNLGYTFKVTEDWRFIAAIVPRLASNFEIGIENNDFRLNASVAFMKERKNIDKPYRFVFGLSYNSATGLPFPLPLLNYNKRFHPNWSYSVGVPRWDIKYHSDNKKHVTQAALFLDGYFVNIQNDVLLPNDVVGTSISLSALVSAVGYQYKFTKEISVYGLVGYSLVQEGLIRDGNRNRAFILNNQGNIYLRTGFKIGIF
ncbi:MAG: hypothetical protein Mars2KO_33790 [Maribacter sp.]|uniref:DUF6268 family outer membrane beta-barrel protein n=1 Tax=Maribacter sp. 2307UL18-2 TaxID=3386274 RepID=UPI0039BD4B0A